VPNTLPSTKPAHSCAQPFYTHCRLLNPLAAVPNTLPSTKPARSCVQPFYTHCRPHTDVNVPYKAKRKFLRGDTSVVRPSVCHTLLATNTVCWIFTKFGAEFISPKVAQQPRISLKKPTDSRPVVGNIWPVVGNIWPVVGNIWHVVGNIWHVVGNIWPVVGNMCPVVGNIWPVVGNIWHVVGNIWPVVGNISHVVGNIWPVVGNIFPPAFLYFLTDLGDSLCGGSPRCKENVIFVRICLVKDTM